MLGEQFSDVAAHFCWDGDFSKAPVVPPAMGCPKEGQLSSTSADNHAELMGRVCYDSLGKGRSSEGYHAHIKEVGHGSVYEHAGITVELDHGDFEGDVEGNPVFPLLGRPGVWFDHLLTEDDEATEDGDTTFRVTANWRAIWEWDRWSAVLPTCRPRGFREHADCLGSVLRQHARKVAPLILPTETSSHPLVGHVVKPETNFEKWITLYLSGSRGFSHEMVRHGDFSAISQRSTRYVDEDGSPYVVHPLLTAYYNEVNDPDANWAEKEAKDAAGTAYRDVVGKLEPWLLHKGLDKTTARKQARGAARGFLGNALQTELFFSANVWQWKNILAQRASAGADAEIRKIAVAALPELRKSRWASDFDGYEVKPSPDDIGEILVRG